MINQFRGKYYFLSNFFTAPITYEGLTYKNNESAFQSAKVLDIEKRKQFTEIDPSSAKSKGRHVTLRHDWEDVKVSIMITIARNKFMQNKDLKQRLLDTKDEDLQEGNSWNDTYWGVCNGRGKNVLGKILMKIRDELKEVEQLWLK